MAMKLAYDILVDIKTALSSLSSGSAVLGSVADASIDADAAGTIKGALRGLCKAFFARIPLPGPHTAAESLSVVPAGGATAAVTSVVAAVADTTLLAANAVRLGAVVTNDGTAVCYLKLGTGASATSYTRKMLAGECYEVPFGYRGAINGYWDAVNGSARVTELTA